MQALKLYAVALLALAFALYGPDVAVEAGPAAKAGAATMPSPGPAASPQA